MKERAFLDFYDQINKVPVSQGNAGSSQHFTQRTSLYRTLGITPLMVKGRDVLEVGPGSGDNALHIASWLPNSIRFIDGARASVNSIETKIEQGIYGLNADIIYQDVSLSPVKGQFDVVLFEGLLPGQEHPKVFLNNVLTTVKPGGVAVFTTVSAVSYLSEICRRVLLPLVKKILKNQDELMPTLINLFQPSFDSLSGMTRKHEDWILDNIIHDWTNNGLFTIEDALKALPENFSILSTSPNFLQDWRWYKEADKSNVTYSNSYHVWSGYLLDYRSQPEKTFSINESYLLEKLSQNAMVIHDRFRNTSSFEHLGEFISCLEQISELVSDKMPETSQSIIDFIHGIEKLKTGDIAADFSSFHQWFGRGQQYISVVKDYNDE